jgi:hypothetical protein
MSAEQLLEQLAAVWVKRWLAYGGGLVADPDCLSIQMDMRETGWRRKGAYKWQRNWHDGWKVGRWRELGELVTHVPGPREAIIQHVTLHGAPYGAGKRCMYVRGAELTE